MARTALRSNAHASALTSREPSEITQWTSRISPALAGSSAPRRPVLEPDLEQQHHHQVPGVDEAEHRHGRLEVGRQEDLERALGMAEVRLQRQRRHDQERQRGEQREPVGRLTSLTLNTFSSEARMKAPATSPVM